MLTSNKNIQTQNKIDLEWKSLERVRPKSYKKKGCFGNVATFTSCIKGKKVKQKEKSQKADINFPRNEQQWKLAFDMQHTL